MTMLCTARRLFSKCRAWVLAQFHEPVTVSVTDAPQTPREKVLAERYAIYERGHHAALKRVAKERDEAQRQLAEAKAQAPKPRNQ